MLARKVLNERATPVLTIIKTQLGCSEDLKMKKTLSLISMLVLGAGIALTGCSDDDGDGGGDGGAAATGGTDGGTGGSDASGGTDGGTGGSNLGGGGAMGGGGSKP